MAQSQRYGLDTRTLTVRLSRRTYERFIAAVEKGERGRWVERAIIEKINRRLMVSDRPPEET